ncbi:MAG: 6-bladed beta-propeller [Bacteroidales bacterium]
MNKKKTYKPCPMVINNVEDYCLFWLLCFITAICMSGCNSRADMGLDRIEIKKSIETPAISGLLSEYFNEVHYVVLETTQDALLHGVSKVLFHDGHFFISDNRNVYQYDKKGSFIRQFGRLGHGPGEYSGMIRFTIDPVNEEVLIFSIRTHTMHAYCMKDGGILYEKEYSFLLSDFTHFKDGEILVFTREFNKDLANFTANEVYKLSPKREIQDSISNALRYNIEHFSMGYANIFTSDSGVYYLYNYRDTLYFIDHFYERVPKAKFVLDNQLSVNTLDISPVPGQIQHKDFLWISNIICNKDYCFITARKGFAYDHEENFSFLVYNFAEETTLHVHSLINNLDYGLPFWPRWYFNEYWIGFYYAHEILNYVSNSGSARKGSVIDNIAEKINVNDNPVLVLVK